MSLVIVPITLRAASAFVDAHHRHNNPPRGWRFGTSVEPPPRRRTPPPMDTALQRAIAEWNAKVEEKRLEKKARKAARK